MTNCVALLLLNKKPITGNAESPNSRTVNCPVI